MLDFQAVITNSPEAQVPRGLPMMNESLYLDYNRICGDLRKEFWLRDLDLITRACSPEGIKLELHMKPDALNRFRMQHFCEERYHAWGWTVHHTTYGDNSITLDLKNDLP